MRDDARFAALQARHLQAEQPHAINLAVLDGFSSRSSQSPALITGRKHLHKAGLNRLPAISDHPFAHRSTVEDLCYLDPRRISGKDHNSYAAAESVLGT